MLENLCSTDSRSNQKTAIVNKHSRAFKKDKRAFLLNSFIETLALINGKGTPKITDQIDLSV